jgi:hypothetical protein
LIRSPWWAAFREDQPRFLYNERTENADDSKDSRRIWRELRRAFELAKNVELQNYAEYRLRVLDEASHTGEEKLAATASRWFWGYGFRPMRTLLCLVLVVLVFAAIYRTQLPTLMGRLGRVRFALLFSARTAWELKYGYNNSGTPAFRVITTTESILAKLILAFFAYALTQTSPLLSELMKKLLP